jgi:hypothetical protein
MFYAGPRPMSQIQIHTSVWMRGVRFETSLSAESVWREDSIIFKVN